MGTGVLGATALVSDLDRRRAFLARSYARALARGGTGDETAEAVEGRQAATPSRLPGYTLADVALLPPEARNSSFGCGNPLAFAGLAEGEVVLDLGSGAGVDLLIAARRVGPGGRVIGVDLTPEMLAQAALNAACAGLANASVCQGLMEDLPVLSSTIHCAISNGAISLSSDKERVFREVFRVLRPEGRMVVADITAEGLPSWVQESTALESSSIAGALSVEGYLEAVSKAGLVGAEVRQRIALECDEIAAILEAELRAYREALGDPQLAPGERPGSMTAEPAPVAAILESGVSREAVAALARRLVGTVWSTTVSALKPR